MSIEKLKSGHYRIRCLVGGKRISITTDRKPSKAEEAFLIQEYIQSLKEKRQKTKPIDPFSTLRRNIYLQRKTYYPLPLSEDITQT